VRTAGGTETWEIARPPRAGAARLVDVAGFRISAGTPLELRALPHPAVTVAVEFGDRGFEITDAAHRMRSPTLAAGLGFTAFRVRAEGIACVQLRLSPLVAAAALGVPLGELAGGVVPLDDLWGRATDRLRDQLHHARSWPERFALLHTELAGRLDTGRAVDPEVAFGWRALVASRGRARVADLAARVGWSRQRLSARFAAQLGVSPKRAAMLVRFDHAVHRLARGEAPARVAADAGYSDQSHLHHDVRAFTGTTPAVAATETWLAADPRAWPTTP
jgi:AraC-like DNA-binding protein